jgi:hypothetical protein
LQFRNILAHPYDDFRHHIEPILACARAFPCSAKGSNRRRAPA